MWIFNKTFFFISVADGGNKSGNVKNKEHAYVIILMTSLQAFYFVFVRLKSKISNGDSCPAFTVKCDNWSSNTNYATVESPVRLLRNVNG